MLIAGCAPVKEAPPISGARTPADLPTECTAAAGNASALHEVDAQRSQIRISVFRDGRLSHLGHNHIVTSGDLYGFVLAGSAFDDTRFALCIPVNALVVDDLSARTEAGSAFSTSLDESQVAATRRNMLSEDQLAGEHYPYVVITGRVGREHPQGHRIAMQLKVRNHHHATDTYADIRSTEGGVVAEGMFQIKLSDLGIQPYSALFGALRVRDELELAYRLSATRRDSSLPKTFAGNPSHHEQEHLTP